jgi:hypothetical protein
MCAGIDINPLLLYDMSLAINSTASLRINEGHADASEC